MLTLKHWPGAAAPAQPFSAEEVRMIGLLAQTWCFGVPPRRHLRAGQ